MAREPLGEDPALHLLQTPVEWGRDCIQQLGPGYGGECVIPPPKRSRNTPFLRMKPRAREGGLNEVNR